MSADHEQPEIKVALVHDWLTGMRGGEYVLEAIAELFPRSDLFTLLYIPGKISPVLTTLKRHTSLLAKVPRIEQRYRSFLPLMPCLIERFDLSGFDLIVSSSHCVAKGVVKPPGAVHVSYVHAPMRYMWDRYEDYFSPEKASVPVRLAARLARKPLQKWDRKVSVAERVDLLVANSGFIGEQIQRAYGRESKVIHPFVDLERFNLPRRPGRNYLMVTAFAPYKKVDLAIEAFNRLRLPLVIVGSGQDEKKLRALAGPTVDFLGQLSNQAITELYSKCRAFVFPGVEDFGITPLEAMASGAPVIAYGRGGATETVTKRTGLFFEPQTVEALMEAVLKLEKGQVSFSEEDCRARAAEFSKRRFQRELIAAIREAWGAAGKDPALLDRKLERSWAKPFLSIIAMFIAIFIRSPLSWAADLESRIAELESKVGILEKALTLKLENCTLTYKHFSYSLNVCNDGTFVHGLTELNSTTHQLDCGYYQLHCGKGVMIDLRTQ